MYDDRSRIEVQGDSRKGESDTGYTPLILVTKDGKAVTNRPSSHVAEHAWRWVPDAVAAIDTKGRDYFVEDVEFPHPTGKSNVIETSEDDDIVFARRPRRPGYSRFVRGRGKHRVPTNKLTVILKRKEGRGEDPNEYLLVTAWIGGISEPEGEAINKLGFRTNDREQVLEARRKARSFWRNHAFVLEHTLHWAHTITAEVPPGWRAILEDEPTDRKVLQG